MSDSLDHDDVIKHVESVEDQEAARSQLKKNDLVAFVINGALLPRASGAEDTVLRSEAVVPFASPSSLETSLTLPNRGEVTNQLSKNQKLILDQSIAGERNGCESRSDTDSRRRISWQDNTSRGSPGETNQPINAKTSTNHRSECTIMFLVMEENLLWL